MPDLFITMFGDPKEWDEDNSIKPLGELVEFQSGSTPSKKKPGYWEGQIPWVSPKDMKKDLLLDAMDHTSELAIEETPANLVPKDSVLIVVRGIILAHTVPVVLAGAELTINQDMKALIPKTDEINSLYLFSALKASHSRLLAQVGTAGHGTRKLDTRFLIELPIMIPSKSKLKIFEAALGIGKQATGQINYTASKLEALFQNLLHRAFSGDLTAEWRKAHMAELLQEMEHQAKVLGLERAVEYEQLGMLE